MTFALLLLLLVSVTASTKLSEEPVRIAYYITVTQTNQPLLARFLNRVYHAENLYLVDYTFPLTPTPQILSKPNIHHRQADPYTPHGVSEVINVLDGMAYFLDREAYYHQSHTFDYFIHCSTDEYPTINAALTKQVLAFDRRTYPPPNYFLFTPKSNWSLFSDELDVFYMDPALSFNLSIPTSKLIRSSLTHPYKYRRTMTLPRSDKHLVVNREYVKQAVDSMLSKRLLLTLADTSHVYQYFFAALAYNSKDPIGPVIKSTSLRCRHEKAFEVEAHKLLEDYRPSPPTMDMLRNSSKPCLFTGPFDVAHGTTMFELIDREFLIPPGTHGRDPGVGFHDRVIDMLKKLQS